MATTLNAGTTTGTSFEIVPDTTGAMNIQTSGVTAVSIDSSQAVTLTNPLPAGSGGTGINTLGTGVATALGQNVNGSGGIVLTASPTLTGTPLAPTASFGTNTTQIATTAFVLANGVPSGAIMMWSGSIGSIPSGWYLCDGTNSTPDLRSKFIVGAGSTYSVNSTGGSADAITVSHTHTASFSGNALGGHSHTITATTSGSDSPNGTTNYPVYNSNAGEGGGTGTPASPTLSSESAGTPSGSVTVASSGSSGTNANLPPYYALAYIMKA